MVGLWSPRAKTRHRCGCYACGWKGYRAAPVTRKGCPKCGGLVTQMMYHPGTNRYLLYPYCGICLYWERNEGFPNRLGTCRRGRFDEHPLEGKETHEVFGCCNFKRRREVE